MFFGAYEACSDMRLRAGGSYSRIAVIIAQSESSNMKNLD